MTQIRVKDFGPIAEASFELKPLTVFMGPNGSGKSYLALATYSLSRSLAFDAMFLRKGSIALFSRLDRLDESASIKQAMYELRKAWPGSWSFLSGPVRIRELPEPLQRALLQASREMAEGLTSDFADEVERCYGVKIVGLSRRGKGPGDTQLEVGISQPESGFSWEMRASNGQMGVVSWSSNLLEQTIDPRHYAFPISLLKEQPAGFLMNVILNSGMFNSGGPMVEAHYMPASRSGILLGHKTLASLIVGQASRAWLQPIEIPRLPGVVTDLIQALLLLGGAPTPEGRLQEVIHYLEGNVTKGTVGIETDTEYPEVYYENESGRYTLHQTSSMVSEIAPIILYLKHVVRPGDVFIIEEPESHIDAENQQRLARAIAMLVNAGVKVLITTHSDFFVNQLSNLLLLSEVSGRRRAARRYKASEVLQPDDVGAYQFNPGKDGTVVETLEVTADGGIPTEQFTDAHRATYDEAIALEHTIR